MPRIVLDGVQPADLMSLLQRDTSVFVSAVLTEWMYVVPRIVPSSYLFVVCNLRPVHSKQGYDGLVWDAGGFGFLVGRELYIDLLRKLSAALHAQKMEFIVVVPVYCSLSCVSRQSSCLDVSAQPLRGAEHEGFVAADFDASVDFVDYYSVMTYDFSGQRCVVEQHLWPGVALC